jgi:hypothetical protein
MQQNNKTSSLGRNDVVSLQRRVCILSLEPMLRGSDHDKGFYQVFRPRWEYQSFECIFVPGYVANIIDLEINYAELVETHAKNGALDELTPLLILNDESVNVRRHHIEILFRGARVLLQHGWSSIVD